MATMQSLIFSIFLLVSFHMAHCEEATLFLNATDTVASLVSAVGAIATNDTEPEDLGTDAVVVTSTAATPTLESGKKTYYISEEIPRCNDEDANLNGCIQNAFEYMLPRVKNGDKDLNIPTVDPFELPRTVFRYSNGPISGRIKMLKALAYGFSDMKIKDLKFNFVGDDRYKFRAKLFIPRLNIVGDYKAIALFNNAKIKPMGTFNLTLNDLNIDLISDGDFYEKDDHRFMRLDTFDVKPIISNFKLNATGLFPDPDLSEVFLNVANQYWRQIYGIMLPETKKYWAPMLMNIVNQAMAVIPYDLVMLKISDNKKNSQNQ